ncbi:MAG TPA: hypothetical protein V6D19_06725 [Stenomitos sp.]
MKRELSIKLSKPIPLLHKNVEANWRELFKAVGKATADTAFGNWGNVALDAVDFTAALGLGTSEAELAWRLMYRSLVCAIASLLEVNRELLDCDPEKRDWTSLSDRLDVSMEGVELTLDEDFFQHPQQSSLLLAIRKPLEQWLRELVGREHEAQVKSMSARLPTYFIYALHEEWAKHEAEYVALQPTETPFSDAEKRERSWAWYRAWLQKQIEEPMFLEAFGLKQVYVKPCAYYEQPEAKPEDEFHRRIDCSRERETRVVVELWDHLLAWLAQHDSRDAIRVISGGPGSGKSSFTKMFAAHVAETMAKPVLYIPLHRLNPAKDLIEAVGDYVAISKFLQHNPLDSKDGEPELLIIFDGLDELAMQGRVGAEVAQAFIREVQSKVGLFNQQQTRLQVILSGREVVVQSNSDLFRKSGQVLHVLPYVVGVDERSNRAGVSHKYLDEHRLLETDRRQEWWQGYGAASGLNYTQLPAELDQGNLTEITAQPLLNYLVALAYQGGRLSIDRDSNLNAIYQDLLSAVYERGWAGKDARHPAVAQMSYGDFERILEEVSLSAWHGNGRTTTVQEIAAHCESGGLSRLLENFQEGAKSGVVRLLTAFYFRQSGQRETGDRTFEFTHKSFGEYLTARRLVRGLQKMHRELVQLGISLPTI